MSPEEFKASRKALGMSNRLMANHLTRTIRTIQRYQYGADDPRNSKIPQLVARVIRHWLENRGITLPEHEL